MSVFISSCSSSVKNPLLLRADSLMETRPDSSLSILESITFPQKLSRSDKAYYALLLTQARHKNYIPLKNDSLIKIAVDYYGDTKESLYASKAHYYWGATYRDMGRTSFAVEEYLKAIQLMPKENEFLAVIYNNLAECYENENLYDTAIEAYRKSYQIWNNNNAKMHPLRGMGYMFLLQNQLDSALYFYQKAFDCAQAVQDSTLMGTLYHDFAMVYNVQQDYDKANEYVSRAIRILSQDKLQNAYLLKGQTLLKLNQLDSASYYFSKDTDELDIYSKAICYDGLYQVEKKRRNWKAAVENADAYITVYDSIQGLSDGEELTRLMDKYQLEKHKKELVRHTRIIMVIWITIFFIVVVSVCFWFLWKDRIRKKQYITLYEELTQKRVQMMRLKDVSDLSKEESAENGSVKLMEQQLQICIQMFQATESYKKLCILEKSNPKQILLMRSAIPSINEAIRRTFIDIMTNLKERCPALTNDDLFYCILSLLHCSKNTITELMGVTSDAIKTRKNRIKHKMGSELFKYIFNSDNQ